MQGWGATSRTVPREAAAPTVRCGAVLHRRRSYAIWREGKPPEFVMEIASASTWRRDRDEKPAIYESLGVREYFLYDPVGGRLMLI